MNEDHLKILLLPLLDIEINHFFFQSVLFHLQQSYTYLTQAKLIVKMQIRVKQCQILKVVLKINSILNLIVYLQLNKSMLSFLQKKISKFSTKQNKSRFQHDEIPQLSRNISLKTKRTLLILIFCFILGFAFRLGERTNSNKVQDRQFKSQNKGLNAKTRSCQIGFEVEQQGQSSKTLFLSNTIGKTNLYLFLKSKRALNQWKYCLIKQLANQGNSQTQHFLSRDWDFCEQKCCTGLQKDQCYFKAFSEKRSLSQSLNQIQNQKVLSFRRLQSLQNNPKQYISPHHQQGLNNNDYTQDNSLQRTVSNLSVEDNSLQGVPGDGSTTDGSQIVMIVLICIFGVPFLLLIFFSIISLVRLCRSSRQNSQTGNNLVQTQNIIIEDINLEDYRMDEIGPFHINLKEQCSICLEQYVNIRTHCGHYYHPLCIRTWLGKGKNKCPVCISQRLNPMKLYCKRCNIGMKLVILSGLAESQMVRQMTDMDCEGCRNGKQSEALSPTFKQEIQVNQVRKSSHSQQQMGKKERQVIENENRQQGQNQNQNQVQDQIQQIGIRSSDNQLREQRRYQLMDQRRNQFTNGSRRENK